MSTKRIEKQALVAATIIFNQADSEPDSPNPSAINNFIDIVTLDGVDGSPVVAGAGTFNIFYKTDVNGGFKTPATNPTLTAAQTSGSAGADGVADTCEFRDVPLEIKIVPVGITVAASDQVHVSQGMGS